MANREQSGSVASDQSGRPKKNVGNVGNIGSYTDTLN